MRMTNQERADQIVNAMAQEIPVLTSNRKRLLHQEILLQLDEAVREAIEKELAERMENLRDAKAWDAGCVEGQIKGFQRGFSAAREKAAGLADAEFNCFCGRMIPSRLISKRILAMEPDSHEGAGK